MECKFALLIDADNISPKYLKIMIDEAKAFGIISIRRIYGDWTDEAKKSWKEELLDNSIIPIQQYSYTTGKNSSDSAMIIDAMDILYSSTVDGFIIVSSDSDFTRLVTRLREAGKKVIGMGEAKTPSSFVKACEEFKTLDVLYKNVLQNDENTNKDSINKVDDNISPITGLNEIKTAIDDIMEKNTDDSGRMLLSELGRVLTKKHPDFDFRNYGRYKKFNEFIKQFSDLKVDLEQDENKSKPPLAYVEKK